MLGRCWHDDTPAMRKILELGGIFSAIVLIAFGIGAIATGIDGKSTVQDNLKQEQITGTPDMTPAAIKKTAADAGLTGVELPTCSVANKPVNDGDSARCFASYMRIHALEATGGKTYSQLPRFATADGKGTNDETAALKNPKSGQPVDNPIRNLWINETALSTALNVSYMAERISLFGIVTGIAMLLAGIGLGILSLFVFGALKMPRRNEKDAQASTPAAAT